MAKILHITPSYKPAYIYGGPIFSVASLCKSLMEKSGRSAKNHTIEVITTLANGKEELPFTSGKTRIVEDVPVIYFKRLTKDHTHFSPALLWWLWRNAAKYNIIHIHAWWNLVSILSTMVCLAKGVRPIISPRGMLSDYTFTKSKMIFHLVMGKYLLKRCILHATTPMEAIEIRKSIFKNLRVGGHIYDLTKQNTSYATGKSITRFDGAIFVIHNVVQIPNNLPPRSCPFDGTLKLIFLSRLHPKKGIELLFHALACCSFPYKLTIVGDGNPDYEHFLRNKVVQLNIDTHVTWKGAINGEKKYELLSSHHLLTLPSYNENFANVVVEAVASGTPVLVSDHVGLKDWVKNNNLGFVCALSPQIIAGTLTEYFHTLVTSGTPDINPNGIYTNHNKDDHYSQLYELVL